MPNLWIIFTTGLIAGGITCAAVQGGLLTATIASQKSDGNKVIPVLSFLLAKLLAYTMLGGLLGYLGTAFTFSLTVQAILLTVVAIFMIGSAGAMLELHPLFRYFVIQPPRFLTRLVRAQTKSASMFGPVILGAFTIFIPCGTTQAMMAVALATRNPLYGAAVMFAFIVGTFPVFFGIGYIVEVLKGTFAKHFARVASLVIVVIALSNLRSAAVITGISGNLNSGLTSVWCTLTVCNTAQNAGTVATNVTLYIEPRGYRTDAQAIAKGQTITMTIINNGASTCAQAFTIPSLGLQEIVPKGQQKTISFKAPITPGRLDYSCSMGMYSGSFAVL